LSSFFSFLQKTDQAALISINRGLQNSFFDVGMPVLRNPNTWIPLYLIVALYVIFHFRKWCWIVFVFAAAEFFFTDQISGEILKPFFARLRPCEDPAIMHQIVLRVSGCGGFSFVSSHATNHFGLALFFIWIMKDRFKWIVPVALIWAAVICFAQVYVGLHYPSDVICGAMLGSCIGYFCGKSCMKQVHAHSLIS
jgi:undecaprenyl-diphosphatase